MNSSETMNGDSGKKGKDSLPSRQVVEIEEYYAVRSRIANSRSMPVMEGYPEIRRNLSDLDHLDPDESEYYSGYSPDSEEAGSCADWNLAESGEWYSGRRKKKPGYRSE